MYIRLQSIAISFVFCRRERNPFGDMGSDEGSDMGSDVGSGEDSAGEDIEEGSDELSDEELELMKALDEQTADVSGEEEEEGSDEERPGSKEPPSDG